MKSYELQPIDSRKSFYGKAVVMIQEDGTETLYSYNTPIIKRTAAGDLIRIWNGWTATTGRHINSFCGLNKREFLQIPYSGPAADPGGRTLTNRESYDAMIARRNA